MDAPPTASAPSPTAVPASSPAPEPAPASAPAPVPAHHLPALLFSGAFAVLGLATLDSWRTSDLALPALSHFGPFSLIALIIAACLLGAFGLFPPPQPIFHSKWRLSLALLPLLTLVPLAVFALDAFIYRTTPAIASFSLNLLAALALVLFLSLPVFIAWKAPRQAAGSYLLAILVILTALPLPLHLLRPW